MRTETVIPALPCRDLDDVLPFYAALGFEQTYRQQRPNPYACVRRGGIELHFFGLPEFDPELSLGNVNVLVEDPGVYYDAFAAGLRAAYGKLPVSGIPRITRPRRKQGTAAGFSVVDPGGNWVRIAHAKDTADQEQQRPASVEGRATAENERLAPEEGRLARAVAAAARQGDSHGDEAAGIRVLVNALKRHADASPAERLPALVYLAELRIRTGDPEAARTTLAEVAALDLSPAERDTLATDLTTAAELTADLDTP